MSKSLLKFCNYGIIFADYCNKYRRFIMDRKKYLMKTVLAVFSLSCVGKTVELNNKFVGDCKTTNDVLGPFYKPKAPLR